MGIFWDLLQQDELEKQQNQTDNVEERVKLLEEDLANTKALLKKTLIALEKHLVQDIDGDGKMG
jgi:stress response protein YsnF